MGFSPRQAVMLTSAHVKGPYKKVPGQCVKPWQARTCVDVDAAGASPRSKQRSLRPGFLGLRCSSY